MSKSDTKTPILIRIDNKLYRIIEMIHAKDGSIYFYMPRKKGYILDSSNIRKHYKKNIFHILTQLIDECKKYENPYISFHPGKQVVHVNSCGYHVKKDYPIYNAAKTGYMNCFLISYLITCDYKIFDEYNKTINLDKDLIINDEVNIDLDAGYLYLDIIIHTSGFEPVDDPIPMFGHARKFICTYTYTNFDGYSVTLALYQSKSQNNNEVEDGNVIVTVNAKEKSLFLSMKPIK